MRAPMIELGLNDETDSTDFRRAFLNSFQFDIGSNEQEAYLNTLRLYKPENTNGNEDEKKEYQFPDNVFFALLYGQHNELDIETDAEDWTLWGLVLKLVHTGDGSDYPVFERVLAVSRLPTKLSGQPGPFPEQRVFHIV